jgi:8-oxo-dGTP pyrophosphatase MutT (NUDIX family)
MKKRDCVRALLFDPMGRLLLFRYRNDPNIHNLGAAPMQTDYWGTVGGGIETGESPEVAILREIEEETGHRQIALGPLVWHRQVDLMFYGEPLHIDEKYFVAHTPDVDISTQGHTQIERKFVAEIKWWDIDALESSKELIYPLGMAAHIRPLQQGIYPDEWLLLKA